MTTKSLSRCHPSSRRLTLKDEPVGVQKYRDDKTSAVVSQVAAARKGIEEMHCCHAHGSGYNRANIENTRTGTQWAKRIFLLVTAPRRSLQIQEVPLQRRDIDLILVEHRIVVSKRAHVISVRKTTEN